MLYFRGKRHICVAKGFTTSTDPEHAREHIQTTTGIDIYELCTLLLSPSNYDCMTLWENIIYDYYISV